MIVIIFLVFNIKSFLLESDFFRKLFDLTKAIFCAIL